MFAFLLLGPAQMVFEEFMKARPERTMGFLFRRTAAWRAFKDMVAMGLLQFSHSR
jgi:hypothetical protein